MQTACAYTTETENGRRLSELLLCSPWLAGSGCFTEAPCTSDKGEKTDGSYSSAELSLLFVELLLYCLCSALWLPSKSFNDDITVSLLFGSELLPLQSAQRRERDEEIRDEELNPPGKKNSGGFLTPAANLLQSVSWAV